MNLPTIQLPSHDILCIAVKGGSVWIGTTKGLARLAREPSGLLLLAVGGGIAILAVASAYRLKERIPGAVHSPREMMSKRVKAPDEICGGHPAAKICGRCQYYAMKSGKDYCTRYTNFIDIQGRAQSEPHDV